MNRYIDLSNKIHACLNAAQRTSGDMREMWKDKAMLLKMAQGELTVEEVMEGEDETARDC